MIEINQLRLSATQPASLNLIVSVLIRPRRAFLTYMHIIHIIVL
jgi:hypothetical protein